jgi:hypothetical protein
MLKDLTEILNSGDLSLDPEGNRGMLYAKIAEEFQTYSYPPILLCEDDPATKDWPGLDDHVAEWMKLAELIAVGGFRQVKEDGRDVCDSETKRSSEIDSGTGGHAKGSVRELTTERFNGVSELFIIGITNPVPLK